MNSDQTKKTARPVMSPMMSSMMSPMMSPMTSPMMSSQMSLDAIHAFDQMKLKTDKSSVKPIQSSSLLSRSSSAAQHSQHHHRHHQQQATTNRRPSHAGYSEEHRPKSVLVSPAPAAMSEMRRMRFASDEQHLSIRPPATAAAEKHRNGKKSPTAATGRNSILSKTVSSNQSTNHSFLLWKEQQEKQNGGGFRSREQQSNACRRMSLPMRENRKPSSSSSSLAHHPNISSSREANAINRMRDGALLLQMQLRLQEEKPFRISPMGYDSRYEDVVYESQRCVVDDDDDIAPEEITQAIDKCRLWLKKHHVDNYGGRRRVNYNN